MARLSLARESFWIASLIVLSNSLGPSLRSEDWPNYRGPSLNGISNESNWSESWPAKGPRIVWRSNVGTGFSSCVISQGRLYTLGNTENQESLFCIDIRNGMPLWKHTYDCDLDDRFFEGGPTSTPTVDGERVFSLSRPGDLICVEAKTGKVHWEKNVQRDIEMRVPGWGFASSPVVHGDRLLLGVGESGLALDKRNGDVIWKSGNGEAGYMTPLPFKLGDRWFALIASGKFYQCVDLDDGRVVWRHRWLTTYGCNAAAPIVRGSQAFISSGYGRGASLLNLREDSYELVWSTKEMGNQLNSSILIDGNIYGFDGDDGGEVQLKCLEFATGEVKWSFSGLGLGSLMAANNRLIALSQEGELLIAPASPAGFQTTARAKVLEGKCWTVPVLSDGFIYCRNAAGDIVCVDVHSQTKE